MKKTTTKIISCFFITFFYGCTSSSNDSNTTSGEHRQVGNVNWTKSYEANIKELANAPIPKNSSNVFFYRLNDNGDLQTSVNVALNGRFQTSLQQNRFSQVYSCTGLNEFHAVITGRKNNELKGFASTNMTAGKNYYFEVGLKPNGRASLTETTESAALQEMSSMNHQSHQISRVVPNCVAGPDRIELMVLFDTDKYFVKPKYYSEIKRVVNYMNKHPGVKVVIEGHTDKVASTPYNQKLSENRAKSVANVLVSKLGISKSRVQAVGFGETRPVASNQTSSGRQKNRRVIAVFSK